MDSKLRINSVRDGAIKAALASGRVLMKYLERTLRIREKKDAGLVTNADLEAEAAAIRVLKKAHADFSFLTEETGVFAQGRGRWILDPLDGTTNFVHGFPMFCVSIGAEWDGEMVVGVVYHPVLKDLYVAVRGRGATLNGKRIRVSTTSKIRDSLMTTGFFTYDRSHEVHRDVRIFERVIRSSRAVRRPGSAALDLAYVARGVFDGFWERKLSPWDMAAGSLLVSEAGGKVTNMHGRPFNVNRGEIIASNGKVHRSLLGLMS